MQQIAEGICVYEHVVFGGMVAEDVGFIRKKMAWKTPPELRDRRDWGAINAWAQKIAATFSGQPAPARP